LFLKYKDVLDQEGKANITRIQKASERMQLLINDILTFSKLSVEDSFFVQSDLNKLVSEVLADMEEEVKEKNAKISINELPSMYVNPGLIRPLFHNLISNALKYSKKNLEPVITIHSEISPTLNGNGSKEAYTKYCRIFIEDNGIGFDQKYSEQIFGMFKRLHLNTEFEGTGIGLALCKKIVEKHNGYISARSKINEGSTFIISLPLEKELIPQVDNRQ
jgi:light-regulated signal transduction histidine kinase (bacteriophytochrome)